MSENSVVIIGGGIAGLTVGYKLKRAGWDVKLIECSPRIGGAMQTVKENGYIAELGPNSILETSPRVTELISEIGLDSEKIYGAGSAKKRYIVKRGKPVALPASPPAFFTSGFFSWKAKLGLLREPFIPPWGGDDEESLAHFVERRLGKEFLDYAINPFVAGVYAGDPAFLSVKHGFPKLYALEQKYGSLIKGQIKGARERKRRKERAKQEAKMFSFRDGLHSLPRTLASSISENIYLNATVTGIEKKENGFIVTCLQDGSQMKFTARKVVYAGTAFNLWKLPLSGDVNDIDLSLFNSIYHPPVATLTLGFRREDIDHPLDGFGVLIPKVEELEILGVLFTSTIFRKRAPEGHVTLTAFIGGARQPFNARKPEDQVLQIALKDLKGILGVHGEPTYVRHTFWKRAIPQYNVGYGQFKKALNSLEMKFNGLYFTGNYRNGISCADTLVNALETVDKILKDV